jgi:hypothetical protein
MLEALRSYVQAASGLTELSRARARELAASVVASGSSGAIAGSVGQQASAIGGSVSQQVTAMAEELLSAGRSNRSALTDLIRAEVESAVARVGLVPAAELTAAHRRIAVLEARVEELARPTRETSSAAGSRIATAQGAPHVSAPRRRPSRAAVASAAGRGVAAAPSTPSTGASAATKRAARKAAPSKKATAKKATAKKATVKKATVKKATVKKATVKKAAPARKAGTVVRS